MHVTQRLYKIYYNKIRNSGKTHEIAVVAGICPVAAMLLSVPSAIRQLLSTVRFIP